MFVLSFFYARFLLSFTFIFYVVSTVFLFSHNATEAYLDDDDVDDFDDPFGDIPFSKLPLNLYPCENVKTEFNPQGVFCCVLCDSIHVLVK